MRLLSLKLSSQQPDPPLRARRGRPRKFAAPSRHVTLTLPDAVIAALGALDRDLSRAVVRLAQPILARRPHPRAELSVWGRRAVIVVTPSRALETRTGATLVPLPDGRALISFNRVTSIAELALLIQDALDDPALRAPDRELFNAIAGILRSSRHAAGVTLVQRNIIVLEAARPTQLQRRPSGRRAS